MNPYEYTPERRPLGARDWSLSQRTAAWLARRSVAPDAISIAGLFASLGAGVALAASGESNRPAPFLVGACALILLRGMCNVFDGMVAVSTGKASRAGELFNEAPDRISDGVTLVGAGYGLGGIPEFGYIAALAAVFTAYVRVLGCALGARADFGGPMAKTHRMFVLVAAALYTAFAPASWQPATCALPHAGTLALALVIVIVGCAITSVRRLKRCVRFLKEGRS